jgi:hypothetical protein
MSSSLSVINEGLVRLGVPPLASLSDRSAQALAADSIYETVKDAALSSHPWSFALREVALPKLSLTAPQTRDTSFEFAYQLPPDKLRVLGLRSYDRFSISGDQLYTNDGSARLVYILDVSEALWPAYFSKHVSLSFAAAVSITLTDNTQRAELMYNLAAEALRTARSTDSLQTPPHVFDLMRVYVRRSRNPLAGA